MNQSADTPIVSLHNVSKSFGRVFALEGINLDFYPGQIVSLVGDNGAGKSTLTKIISGTEDPDSGGEIIIESEDEKGCNFLIYLPLTNSVLLKK